MRHFTGGGMLHIETLFPHIPNGMSGVCGGFYADNEVGLRETVFPYAQPCGVCRRWWDNLNELINSGQTT